MEKSTLREEIWKVNPILTKEVTNSMYSIYLEIK